MKSAIRARGLRKEFGNIKAVRELDLEIGSGEIYGFLGRNGAGKTTTIRMILGLIRPSGGEIEIFGESIRTNRRGALRKVGFLVESATAYPNLTVSENLDLQRRLTGAPRESVEAAIGRLRLEEYADRVYSQLSLGNKQRLSLARALINAPKLLILDEPANGLDPAGIVEVREMLRSLATAGTTIFMSSHILAEVDQLADRIGIIHEGRLLEELDRGKLGERRRLYIELCVDRQDEAETILRDRLGLRGITRQGERCLRIADPGARCADIAAAVVGAGMELDRLAAVEESLEERFMRMTGGQV